MHQFRLIMLAAFGLLLLAITATGAIAADCSDAYYAADDAYGYARKGYRRADDLDEVERYAKKAMSSASDAESYADDCGCDDANGAASDTYRYSRKAYRSGHYEDATQYLKKALRSAEDAMSYADDCG